jgi:hypothetical protein
MQTDLTEKASPTLAPEQPQEKSQEEGPFNVFWKERPEEKAPPFSSFWKEPARQAWKRMVDFVARAALSSTATQPKE